MRVATFNIRNGAAEDGLFAWPARRSRFLEFLTGLEADILCLQEVLDFQLDEISAALSGHSHFGVGRDDGRRAGEFVPIFYRNLKLIDAGTIWLSDTPEVPGSIAWGARLPRICTWARFPHFTIANVHLDHESEAARNRGVGLLLKSLRADILCGDFNAEPGEAAISAVDSAGYVDLGSSLGGTYNNFRPEIADAPRIDYIFATPQLSGVASIVREPLVSDHWPILFEF